ncbi:hypothetical protein NZK35_20895 [Stieleria sp. ICT_E10.1]|uniref:hypothetical protein n=1 Tax=Stieleria sedimenti TaxID=2976331 RepID=UPI002180833B|nr:hypothetical protein [Stieleria sedimenti]MCS7469118.1 hypothetical protein [Stieleria sedimenti]
MVAVLLAVLDWGKSLAADQRDGPGPYEAADVVGVGDAVFVAASRLSGLSVSQSDQSLRIDNPDPK